MKLPLKNRLILIVFFVLSWSVLIGWRLYDIQIVRHESFREKAQKQQERTITLHPQRGAIYDRNGKELAVSVDVASIYVSPSRIEDIQGAAKKLSKILACEGLSYKDILVKLKKKSPFVWIKRQVSENIWEEIKALGIEGIGSIKESKRYYPKLNLACHVLGYVSVDEEGTAGIERQYNDLIRGQPAMTMVIRDAKGDRLLLSNTEKRKNQRGKNIYLTIDEIIQFHTEKELDEAVRKYGAKSGTVIVMDPNSGEILALANRPGYDPNFRFSKFPENEWPNRAVSDVYEPGSTFKVFTALAALEEGVVRPDEVIYCGEGQISVAGKIIRDHERYADLSFRDIIAHSSNVGAIKVGMRMSKDVFFRRICSYGFGSRSGVDLPAESPGILHPTAKWSGRSLASIAMGQEVAVTPLQVLNSFNIIANGGYHVTPSLVKMITTPEGLVFKDLKNSKGKRVVSETTCRLLGNILASVVKDGTAKDAFIDGYSIAGKTGTAQKADGPGGYSATKFVASFMGFFPADNPKISMIVIIDEPAGGLFYGGKVAAPVFRNIASSIIMYMGIPSENEDRHFRTVYRHSQGEAKFAKAGIAANTKGL